MLKFFIAIIIVSTVEAAPTENQMWLTNLQNSLSYRCVDPQRRTFKADRLLGDKLKFFESPLPHTAVLHRCDNDAGCCNNAFDVCAPVLTEEVRLTFLVKSKNGLRYEVYVGKNHTACGCKDMGNEVIK